MTRPEKNPGASGIRTSDLPLSRRTPKPLGQRGGKKEKRKGRESEGRHKTRNSAVIQLGLLIIPRLSLPP